VEDPLDDALAVFVMVELDVAELLELLLKVELPLDDDDDVLL
jgi:hypothetical protein